jgi:hypothetical protein
MSWYRAPRARRAGKRIRLEASRSMVFGALLRRRSWLLLVVVFAALLVGSFFVPLPVREADKADAARNLVAWIVEGRSVPGFGESYPDARWMPKKKRIFVVCDFLPAGVSLSEDPRVQRVTAQEYDEVFKHYRFNDTDYIFIELKSESASELVVEFSNVFASLAGHGYRFEFRRTVWGLRATGKFLWVS